MDRYLATAAPVQLSAERRRHRCDKREVFIPLAGIDLAADKRALARRFAERCVPTPQTFLANSVDEARQIVSPHTMIRWCLKHPTSCGGSGHRILTSETNVTDWPRPLVVQEFVQLERPEVYRITSLAGSILVGLFAGALPA